MTKSTCGRGAERHAGQHRRRRAARERERRRLNRSAVWLHTATTNCDYVRQVVEEKLHLDIDGELRRDRVVVEQEDLEWRAALWRHRRFAVNEL